MRRLKRGIFNKDLRLNPCTKNTREISMQSDSGLNLVNSTVINALGLTTALKIYKMLTGEIRWWIYSQGLTSMTVTFGNSKVIQRKIPTLYHYNGIRT